MQYQVLENKVKVFNITDFNLGETFDCGQCFRWDSLSDGSFIGVAFNKLLKLRLENNTLILDGCNEKDFLNIWQNYFDLKLDYRQIRNYLKSLDCTLDTITQFAPGIRILNQDPWETLCSFIISQNNNIPRIKGIISKLCSKFGNPINNSSYYSFPEFERIACLNKEDLEELKSGFRAPYILDAARKLASGYISLQDIKTMPIEDARCELMKIKGVGPKVAECTLLYGFHRLEAFPMDVWMKRAMYLLFPEHDASYFGKYAGIAQQYIFHYSRSHPEIFSR